jgi:hypothetical protein
MPVAFRQALLHLDHHDVAGGRRREIDQRDLQAAHGKNCERRRVKLVRHHVLGRLACSVSTTTARPKAGHN